MKKIVLLFVFALAGCGGSLTEDQRKAIKHEMETSKIQKVSEAEITEAAFRAGRKLMGIINGDDRKRQDSLTLVAADYVHFVTTSTKEARSIEWELFEAYEDVEDKSSLADNVQPIRTEDGLVDSLLYTYPMTYDMDGKKYLQGVWNIWLSKKQLILSLQEKD